MARRVARQAFVLYVNTNMLTCSIVFVAWALPRETISGLMGRWAVTETGWKRVTGVIGSWIVDRIYFWEPNHCRLNAAQEAEARRALYP